MFRCGIRNGGHRCATATPGCSPGSLEAEFQLNRRHTIICSQKPNPRLESYACIVDAICLLNRQVSSSAAEVSIAFEASIGSSALGLGSELIVNDRLLASTVGLETFLSTVNYVLYILISINPRSNPSPASLESLTTLISDTRTTLRLTALLPLYSSLRAQLTDRAKKDRYLRAISLIQCIAYIFFQFTENVAFLADRGIISQRRLARAGGSTKWWIWSSRAWLAGVSCDFLKLFREALIERQQKDLSTRTSKEEVSAEAKHERMAGSKWWSEVFIASCWLPLCLHYSLQDGLLGMNNRVVGLLGLMAGAQGCTAQWAKTNIT